MSTNESSYIKKEEIQKIINELNHCFKNDSLIKLFRNISNNTFEENKEIIDLSYFSNFDENIFSNPVFIGSFEVEEGDICILSIKTKKELNEKSGKKKQYDIAKSYLKIANEYVGGFFIFYDENSNFRFSFVYDIPIGGGKRVWSNFRRYTYFISNNLTNRTFIEQFSSADFKSLNGIIEAFSVEKVTKEFYQQIANWYFWAVHTSRFPEHCELIQNGRNDAIIRLITRIIFIWFMKEKKIIPDLFFDFDSIKKILKEFDLKGGFNYYKSILQNLFFAALNNQNKDEKKFHYLEEFQNKDEILQIFKKIPFLNGGLFECLDMKKFDPENEFSTAVYIDGFCEYPDKQPKIPNYLFFGENYTTNLSEDYNDSAYSQAEVKGLIDILKSYNFTIDENSLVDQEVALDPELLGKVFENLLASYNPETATSARKATGSFYTPRQIVDFMVNKSIKQYFINHLKDKINNFEEKLEILFDYNNEENPFNDYETDKLIELIENIKILDPAVGSGAFLMAALHLLCYILGKLDPHNKKWKKRNIEAIEKDIHDPIIKEEFIKKLDEDFKENEFDYGRKLYLIKNCLFGVDIQQIAIQISKLRFFISLLVEQKIDFNRQNFGIQALPNLETKLVCADTLIHLENEEEKNNYLGHLFESSEYNELENKLLDIRSKYFMTSDPEKKILLKEEDKNVRLKIISKYNEENRKNFPEQVSEKIIKIARWNPYKINSKSNWFDPEWMFGVKDGFDIVIGNPPYIQLQKDGGKIANLYKDENYNSFARTGDIYTLFYEKGMKLLKPNGFLCYITSNKWMRAGYGEKLREFFTKFNPVLLIDLGPNVFENATVDTNILLIQKATNQNKLCALTLQKTYDQSIEEQVKKNSVILTKLTKDAWFIGNDAEQQLKEKIERIGKPLKEWDVKIYRGLVTGDNNGLVLKDEYDIMHFQEHKKYLKPYLFGEDIMPFFCQANKILIAIEKGTKTIDNNFLLKLQERDRKCNYSISKRKEKGNAWYELRGCKFYNLFDKELMVWSDIVKKPSFALTIPGTYIDTSAYFMDTSELLKKFFLGILNSRLSFYYFKQIAPDLGNKSLRWKKIFLEKLPIPPITSQNAGIVAQIEALVDKILQAKKHTSTGDTVSSSNSSASTPHADTSQWEREIDRLVYELYGLTEEEIEIIENKK